MTDRTSPLFSIITVTLNNIAGLKETHRSLKLQTFRDFEWIVMDGGSNDASADYLKTTDAQWHSEKDEGLYDAMNEGIARAKGDYLLFLNAGDMFADAGILEEIAKHAEKKPDFIYGDALETQGGTNPPFYKSFFRQRVAPRHVHASPGDAVCKADRLPEPTALQPALRCRFRLRFHGPFSAILQKSRLSATACLHLSKRRSFAATSLCREARTIPYPRKAGAVQPVPQFLDFCQAMAGVAHKSDAALGL